MHIGMIHLINRSFPPDIRIEKEAKALAAAGHKVTVLAKRIPADALPYEQFITNYFVKRVEIKTPHFFSKYLTFFTLFHRECISSLKEFITKDRPDFLHVHDFDFVPTVVKVAREFQIPVVADLHENMPAAHVAYRSSLPQANKWANAILTNYHLWKWHEAQILPQCARVIVVVPEAVERLQNYGIPDNKLVVVSNTEDETTFQINPKQSDPAILDRYKDHWVISYIGGIGPHRGLDTVIQSLPYIGNEIPNLKLVIVGARSEQQKQIASEAQSLGVDHLIETIGWQPFEKVNSYVQASQVCLVPHNDFEHTQTTVPHKLFQYMICKKPVLVSNCRPLKRIVDDAGAGLVFRANDAKDLADKLKVMHSDPEKLQQMGLQGHKVALGKYSWRHDGAKLVDMYETLVKELKP